MEMTPAYLAETVAVLDAAGFEVAVETEDYGDEHTAARATRYVLRRGEAERLTLEVVERGDEHARYYFELGEFHGMTSFSYPLDSWKHREDRVEFRFYSDVRTGQGLAITVRIPRGAPT